ncbi:ABC transporter permease [Paenibacillus koleovorans]|uniref:ABC transporter permease n=1 Tax=Paenibacillus koleovorans TaxID=121608 RepID=UPI000FDCCD5D|nr:ABC transporter permease [Paenibacillus koleovorans]
MVNLVLNENMKIYRRARTLFLVGFLVALVLFINIVDWNSDRNQQSEGWQAELRQEKAERIETLKRTDLSEETRTYLIQRIALIDYHMERNIPTEDGTMWDGINDSAGMVPLITILTIIVAGDIMAGEFSAGTIKLLLIRPASRLKILIAKYISTLIFSALLLIALFLVSVIINGILHGFGDLNLPLIEVTNDGFIVEKSMALNLWKTYLLNGVSTVLYVTMAFMISSAFRSSTMAIALSIVALFGGFMLQEALHRFSWSKYLWFTNTDLTQYLRGTPYQEGMTLTFSICVLAVYFVAFNLVSWLMFTRRDVAS